MSAKVDTLGRSMAKPRTPKGLNRKTIVHWWNKGFSVGRLAKKYDCSEQNICYHIRGAHEDGMPVRTLKAKLSRSIAREIHGHVTSNFGNCEADIYFEKLTPYQRVMLGYMLREKDKSFLMEIAASFNWQTRRALLKRGLLYWRKLHGRWVLTITDRGQQASNTHPPVEVYLHD